MGNFHGFLPPEATKSGARCNSHNDIYDIGTEILYFQFFVTTDMVLFSISIIPEDLESSRRDLAFGSVKTRFKAILKKPILGLGFACGHLPWSFKTTISFDICSKEVLTMRNRFFKHPKPQKLNLNELLRF